MIMESIFKLQYDLNKTLIQWTIPLLNKETIVYKVVNYHVTHQIRLPTTS